MKKVRIVATNLYDSGYTSKKDGSSQGTIILQSPATANWITHEEDKKTGNMVEVTGVDGVIINEMIWESNTGATIFDGNLFAGCEFELTFREKGEEFNNGSEVVECNADYKLLRGITLTTAGRNQLAANLKAQGATFKESREIIDGFNNRRKELRAERAPAASKIAQAPTATPEPAATATATAAHAGEGGGEDEPAKEL